ncbi:hypothetical protein CRE_30313 [Caenorhabditis remanei]|uniref:BAR domain-containing protein n=1 Tax=Caenorhabditis remanei TaxID=31234 RepID=E3NRV2_CAERE|nr:hypothetical protein CRE_30313 [Caenorhabditis remanei]
MKFLAIAFLLLQFFYNVNGLTRVECADVVNHVRAENAEQLQWANVNKLLYNISLEKILFDQISEYNGCPPPIVISMGGVQVYLNTNHGEDGGLEFMRNDTKRGLFGMTESTQLACAVTTCMEDGKPVFSVVTDYSKMPPIVGRPGSQCLSGRLSNSKGLCYLQSDHKIFARKATPLFVHFLMIVSVGAYAIFGALVMRSLESKTITTIEKKTDVHRRHLNLSNSGEFVGGDYFLRVLNTMVKVITEKSLLTVNSRILKKRSIETIVLLFSTFYLPIEGRRIQSQKKSPNESDDKKHVDAAVDQVGHTGWYNRFKVHLGQKLGTAECTKLEPRFDRNIEKLLSYHNIIFNMVDAIELQVQIDPSNISKKRVLAPPEKNLWSQLGGWFHFLSLRHYSGAEAHLLDRFSYTCSKIAQKEMQIQKRTRTHLIKRMLLYIGDESVELNNSVEQLNVLLSGIDETRHAMILGFNSKASEIQGWIDEVTIIVTLHQNELIKFSRELSMYHDSVYNAIMEVLLRLGYHVHRKK